MKRKKLFLATMFLGITVPTISLCVVEPTTPPRANKSTVCPGAPRKKRKFLEMDRCSCRGTRKPLLFEFEGTGKKPYTAEIFALKQKKRAPTQDVILVFNE